ncbi:MAG: hypothetical protein RI560_01220 [Natronomonas sp.]|nr:hypothetical protein [Natronomonas sp.]
MKRRTALIGLGSLAFGSGATLSASAFQNSVSPSSDMRVVVEEQLIVEPGAMFRDGDGDPDGQFNPNNSGGGGGTSTWDNDSYSIFGGNGDPGLEDIGFGDVRAVSANDATNGDLKFEVALPFDDSAWIGNDSDGFMQIRNDTSDPQTVAIRFEEFGTDTTGNQDSRGGDVSESDVVNIYEFKDSSRNQISSVDTGSDVDDQTVADTVTISPGAVEQVFIDFDTTISKSDIEAAAGAGNPFGDGTADLVDTLRVGTDPFNTQ